MGESHCGERTQLAEGPARSRFGDVANSVCSYETVRTGKLV